MADADHDVVVIGSGAGGGAAAWALCEQGLRVLLLEAGPAYVPETDYRLHRSDWETARFPDKLPPADRQTLAPLQALEARHDALRSWNHVRGRVVPGDTRRSVGYSHVVGLGGSTLHFAGEAHRMHPEAMRMASRFGVAADWPVDYATLEPYYTRIERLIGVAGSADDTSRPRSAPYPLPPHPRSYASQRLAAGAEALGLGFVPNPLAALSKPYDGRPGCNYCAGCLRGCPRRDKGSVDVTFVRRARESGRCEIRTECQVTRLVAGDDDRIRAIVTRSTDGLEREERVRSVVLAAGAVETPRLLLLSTAPGSADGLANDSGQVGRHFMETLSWYTSGLHPEPLGSHRGLPSDSICWDFNAPDAIDGVVGGCRFSPGTAEADLLGPVSHATRVVRGFGRAHQEGVRDALGRVLTVASIGESLPGPKSFVDLDPVARDAAGNAKARIHSHLDDAELRRLTFMARTCREILAAAGVEEVFEEAGTYDLFFSTHVFGTCRMGTDPETSVVDAFGRSHRFRNLFVADASVFPSSGGGESPSLTIEALALRTAEHLAARARRRELDAPA